MLPINYSKSIQKKNLICNIQNIKANTIYRQARITYIIKSIFPKASNPAAESNLVLMGIAYERIFHDEYALLGAVNRRAVMDYRRACARARVQMSNGLWALSLSLSAFRGRARMRGDLWFMRRDGFLLLALARTRVALLMNFRMIFRYICHVIREIICKTTLWAQYAPKKNFFFFVRACNVYACSTPSV